MQKILFVLFGSLVLVLATGCGGKKLPKDMPALRPVSLTLAQEGEPLKDATVVLMPSDPENSWAAGGVSDHRGKTVPRTMGQYSGVPEGRYKVTVSKQTVEASRYLGPQPREMKRRQSFHILKSLEQHDVYLWVDSKYGNPETTPLTLEVTKQGANATFDVGKAVKEHYEKDHYGKKIVKDKKP